jgi:hypothetical protein
MRQRNMRLIIVGALMVVLAAGFFLFFMGIAPKSNDPVELMKTVGQVSGVVGFLGVGMAIFGFIGKKPQA